MEENNKIVVTREKENVGDQSVRIKGHTDPVSR